MKLDPRIEKDTLIYTPFSIDGTNEMIALHDKGYFTDDMSDFNDLRLCAYGELVNVSPDGDSPYACIRNDKPVEWYPFYIPECILNPVKKKKKLRPYNLMEFTDKFTVGRPIKFREKGRLGCERYLILNGYWHELRNELDTTYIYIGPHSYSLDELFNCYEWQEHYTSDFQPFGVEDTE